MASILNTGSQGSTEIQQFVAGADVLRSAPPQAAAPRWHLRHRHHLHRRAVQASEARGFRWLSARRISRWLSSFAHQNVASFASLCDTREPSYCPPRAFRNQEFSRSANIRTRNRDGCRLISPAPSLSGPQQVSGGEMASIPATKVRSTLRTSTGRRWRYWSDE